MYLIATNEYLVNIISFMFFDFFSPFCTFANGQKYQKYEESLVSKFIMEIQRLLSLVSTLWRISQDRQSLITQ